MQTVPLNIGYIGGYLKQEVSAVTIELFKDPQKLYDTLVAYPERYTCLALSNYDWNFNLNRHFLKLARRLNPEIITVMGGPNIDGGTEEGLKEFFHYFPELDFYILGEGEDRFAALIKSIIRHNWQIQAVWEGLPGTIVGYDRKNRRLLRGKGADVGFVDCRTLPSPYLSGILDEFLANPHLVPIIETNRGCPYSCAYCCRGNAGDSKIREFSKETVLEELQYISARTQNPLKALYIADSNFGILKQDIAIAQAIKNINHQNGSYRNIYMFFAKNINEDMIKVAETLKELTDISMSKQTLNPEVLTIIGRNNISDTNYNRLLAKLHKLGISRFCELIYGLPGESLESFLNGLEKMYEKEVNISVYPLLLLKGSKINSKDFRDQYQIKSGFRIMPRYTGSYGEINSVEYEEILISHTTLPPQDYLQIRLIVFFHVLFFERIFAELVLFLRENQSNLAALFRFMVNDRRNWPTIFADFIRGFEKDTRGEILAKKELKLDFTKDEINDIREKVLDLNTYYLCKLIAARERVVCFKEYLFEVLQRYFVAKAITVDTDELNWVLDMSFDKIADYHDIKKIKTVSYPYDIDAWLKQERKGRLSSFKTRVIINYRLELDDRAILMLNAQVKALINFELSIYRLRKQFIISQINPAHAYTYRRVRS